MKYLKNVKIQKIVLIFYMCFLFILPNGHALEQCSQLATYMQNSFEVYRERLTTKSQIYLNKGLKRIENYYLEIAIAKSDAEVLYLKQHLQKLLNSGYSRSQIREVEFLMYGSRLDDLVFRKILKGKKVRESTKNRMLALITFFEVEDPLFYLEKKDQMSIPWLQDQLKYFGKAGFPIQDLLSSINEVISKDYQDEQMMSLEKLENILRAVGFKTYFQQPKTFVNYFILKKAIHIYFRKVEKKYGRHWKFREKYFQSVLEQFRHPRKGQAYVSPLSYFGSVEYICDITNISTSQFNSIMYSNQGGTFKLNLIDERFVINTLKENLEKKFFLNHKWIDLNSSFEAFIKEYLQKTSEYSIVGISKMIAQVYTQEDPKYIKRCLNKLLYDKLSFDQKLELMNRFEAIVLDSPLVVVRDTKKIKLHQMVWHEIYRDFTEKQDLFINEMQDLGEKKNYKVLRNFLPYFRSFKPDYSINEISEMIKLIFGKDGYRYPLDLLDLSRNDQKIIQNVINYDKPLVIDTKKTFRRIIRKIYFMLQKHPPITKEFLQKELRSLMEHNDFFSEYYFLIQGDSLTVKDLHEKVSKTKMSYLEQKEIVKNLLYVSMVLPYFKYSSEDIDEDWIIEIVEEHYEEFVKEPVLRSIQSQHPQLKVSSIRDLFEKILDDYIPEQAYEDDLIHTVQSAIIQTLNSLDTISKVSDEALELSKALLKSA